MPSQYDLLFGRVATELGYVSKSAVEACLAALESSPSSPRLGVVLKERGYLTREAFREISEEVMARCERPVLEEEEVFGRLCLRRKFLLAYQVRRGLGRLREDLERGEEPVPLRDVFLEERVLSPEQVDLVEKDRRNVLLCPGCRSLVDVRRETPGTEIACRSCDHLLVVPEGAWETEPPAPSPRQGIGPYELVREIGRGSMGVVYEARERKTGKALALKILPETLGFDASALERFHREAALAAELAHPAVVPILHVGEEEGVWYAAMDFIDGETLDTLVGHAPLPVDLAARTARQAAEGLHYAHERGIIHRDVKPANILIDRENRARILDFGLAKQRDVATITASGTVVGTPMYMSPEQASPSAPVDFRTDIYSLGATLYEVLTGVPPFMGEDVQALIRKVKHESPPAPRSLRPDIPRPLENIVFKAMAKDPSRRYASASDFAGDLGRFLSSGHAEARPRRLWERGKAAVSRHLETVGVAVLACVLLAGAWLLWQLSKPPGASSPDERADMEALASRAFDALRLGRHEEAEALYTRLHEKDPSDGEILLFRALARRGRSKGEAALEDLDQALVLDGGLSRARWERASLFLDMGLPGKAARDLERYLETHSGAEEAKMLLARAYRESGRRREARAVLEGLVRSNPGGWKASLALAELERENDPASARDRLRALADRTPDLPGVHFQLGLAQEALGRWAEALASLEEEARRQGDSPDLQEAIERVRRRLPGDGK